MPMSCCGWSLHRLGFQVLSLGPGQMVLWVPWRRHWEDGWLAEFMLFGDVRMVAVGQ